MRDIPTQQDGVTSLSAEFFNEIPSELENAITSSGQTLTPPDGSSPDLRQLARAMAIYASTSRSYTSSGSVNSYTLTTIGAKSSLSSYTDGMEVSFFAIGNNTGAVTINVDGLGARQLVNLAGAALSAGDITNHVQAQFVAADNRFVLLNDESDNDNRYLRLTGGTLVNTLNINQGGAALVLRQDGNANTDTSFIEFRQANGTRVGIMGASSSNSNNIAIGAEAGHLSLFSGSNNVNIDNPHSNDAQGGAVNALTRRDYVDSNFLSRTSTAFQTINGNVAISRASDSAQFAIRSNTLSVIRLGNTADSDGGYIRFNNSSNDLEIGVRDSNVDVNLLTVDKDTRILNIPAVTSFTQSVQVSGSLTKAGAGDLIVADQAGNATRRTNMFNNAGVFTMRADLNSANDGMGSIIFNANFIRHTAPTINMDGGTNTTVNILSTQEGQSTLNVHGAGQGSGTIFVGQEAANGGGFRYNGDDQPDLVGGVDRTTFFRRFGNSEFEVFSYGLNSSDVQFEGGINANNQCTFGNTTGTPLSLERDSAANINIEFFHTGNDGLYFGRTGSGFAFGDNQALNVTANQFAVISESGIFQRNDIAQSSAGNSLARRDFVESNAIRGSNRVVSEGSNANGHYRRWSDGFTEQWGDTTTASATFPIAFTSTTNLRVQVSINSNSSLSNGFRQASTITTTGFTVAGGSAAPRISYYASGF